MKYDNDGLVSANMSNELSREVTTISIIIFNGVAYS